MSRIMICTGKKKHVEAMNRYFRDLERSKEIEILASRQATKKVLLWSYEESKILFNTKKPGASLQVESGLIRSLDYFSIKERVHVQIDLTSPTKEDDWLKFKIMTSVAQFRLRGGKVEIREEIHKEGEYRKKRTCYITLTGPVKLAFHCRDVLIQENLAEPKSAVYMF